jgi:hypothetical protein
MLMTDFFKPDPRITDPALRDLEKKVHWLMYQINQGNWAQMQSAMGLDYQVPYNTFPNNFDVNNIGTDAQEVQNNGQ